VNDEVIRLHLWRQHVKSEYVQVDGYRIHYFEAEPKPGLRKFEGDRPLLLVHGLGSRAEDWAAMIPTLEAQGFHVYAPDLLGYGRSPRPDVNYSIPLQEKTMVDFMRAVGLSHADVGGWSMGGWVALKLAVDHPEMVDRLVVYDAAGVYFPPTFEASLFVPKDSAAMAHLQEMLTPEPKPMLWFVQRAVIRKLEKNGWVIERGVDSMESGKDLLDFRLHRIKRPVLIVWGKEDKLIPLAVGEEMRRKIEGSSMLVVDGCGHLAPSECPKPVLKGTVEFLKAEPALRGVRVEVSK
jgi:pimeloyl-ACP methyl ester carboxylesterase